VQLVADANVLLSAVIGGRAASALRHEKVERSHPTTAYDKVFSTFIVGQKRHECDFA
jgi:hypothetical protein